jgi:hypothetical protein
MYVQDVAEATGRLEVLLARHLLISEEEDLVLYQLTVQPVDRLDVERFGQIDPRQATLKKGTIALPPHIAWTPRP